MFFDGVPCNPSRVDAKREDHVLQADLLIAVSEHITSVWPTSMISPCQEGKSSPDALRRSA